MHGGDEMCCQRRYNLSPATNCAGATKCAVTGHLATKPRTVNAFLTSRVSLTNLLFLHQSFG